MTQPQQPVSDYPLYAQHPTAAVASSLNWQGVSQPFYKGNNMKSHVTS